MKKTPSVLGVIAIGFLACSIICVTCVAAVRLNPKLHEWLSGPTKIDLPINNSVKPGQSKNIELVSQFGGSILYMATQPFIVEEGIAYTIWGPRLRLLNITDPTHISILGQTTFLPYWIDDITRKGKHVFALARGNPLGEDRILIFDVSDPRNPQLVNTYNGIQHRISRIKALGGFLFVFSTSPDSGSELTSDVIHILDISEPAKPKEVGLYHSASEINDLAISGEYGFVATGKNGLQILNIKDPTKPTAISSLYPSDYGQKVLVSGNYVYFAGALKGSGIFAPDKKGLYIIDISNPYRPIEMGYQEIRWGTLIDISDGIAYWPSNDGSTLYFVDIADPHHPRILTAQVFSNPGHVITVKDNLAYILNNEGLKIADVSMPEMPTVKNEYRMLPASQVAFREDKVFIFGGWKNGLDILDISDRLMPALASNYTPANTSWIRDIMPRGQYLCVNAGRDGFQILEVSDLAHPKVVGSYILSEGTFFFSVSGIYAFVATEKGNLYVLDVSDPSHIRRVNQDQTFHSGSFVNSIAVVGNYIYVGADEIYIIDISDPANPAEVGTFDSASGSVEEIVIIDHIAFLVETYTALETLFPYLLAVIDISDPTQPTLIDSYDWTPWWHISGKSLNEVLITDLNGLHILDFTKTRSPKEVAYYGLPRAPSEEIQAVFGDNNFIYAADDSLGLYTLIYKKPDP